jgi:hypothetical protein
MAVHSIIRRDGEQIVDLIPMLDSWVDEQAAIGKMLGTDAIKADVRVHGARFTFLEGRLVDADSGADYRVVLQQLLDERSHWQPVVITDDDEAAFGSAPTLKARAHFIKTHGAEVYHATMAAWGASDRNLKPGTKPTLGEDKRTNKPTVDTDKRLNPWLHLRDPSTGKIDPKAQAQCTEIIRTKGIAAAKALCTAAGVTLGGTPLAARFR